ncbi:hypothetical protein CPB84DRAFT_1775902 [Gymnopilus junonius]|uniref:ribonuclease Z n=1 Tax=Gymnopilus junonius TaxID=109634 RepID=A0A9P5NR93_GYMJU|nr:hypothetical protein CPB84DRAFT_1775902 [Gymnopilus junonius]
MNWSTSVLTTISSDTEPSIIVTFDNAKYIFNTSENTTRSFLQSGRTWRKAKALFFTQARVEKTSGLVGLIMTFADATISDLQLIGPQGLNHILASMRLFTFRDSMKVQPSEIPWISPPSPTPTPCYSDDNVKVYAIPVLPFPRPTISSSEGGAAELPSVDPLPTEALMETSTEGTGKRKREHSPDSPHKKSNLGDTRLGKVHIYPPLFNEMGKPHFRPENLEGELADAYRQLVIQKMFPGTNIKAVVVKESKPPQAKKITGKVDKVNKHGGSNSPKTSRSFATDANQDTKDPDDYKRSRSPLTEGFRLQLPNPSFKLPPSETPPAVSYLIVGPQHRGKFNAAKATELGVPKGHIRAALARGETITFEVKVGEEIVQRTVKAEEVVAKPELPGAVLILDVPSNEHVPALVASFRDTDFYQKFWFEDPVSFESQNREYNTRVVYHMLGEGVLEDEGYKAFMNGFGPLAHHIIASREHCPDPVTFTSAAYSQLRLNKVDDKMFRMPKYSLTPKKDMSMIYGLPQNCQPMASHLTTTMRPWAPPAADPEVLKRDKLLPVLTEVEPLTFSDAMQASVTEAQKDVAEVIRAGTVPVSPGADVGIITLGTGGSLPSKYRNGEKYSLSTLVQIPGYGNILLDVDSGYNVWHALRDLKCIFVSHLHADHHMGLAAAGSTTVEPLYVVSIRVSISVQDLGLNDPSGNGVVSVFSESLHYKAVNQYLRNGLWQIGGDEPWLDFQKSVDNAQRMCNSLGLNSIQTVDMYHKCRCYGVSLRHRDGWSVAFSGDTAPSDNLRRIGMNTTVLIHEATMADEEADVASQKAHSTIGQAIAEGKTLDECKNILLTHFSAQRHPVPENFRPPELTIGDMWKMQFYLTCVSNNFLDTYDKSEDDALTTAAVDNVSRV